MNLWPSGYEPDEQIGRLRGSNFPFAKRRLPGARSSKRAGSAVGLRPAPKARSAAHPQERQHSAAEGGTRDRVRPAGTLRCGAYAARVRDRDPNGRRRELLMVGP